MLLCLLVYIRFLLFRLVGLLCCCLVLSGFDLYCWFDDLILIIDLVGGLPVCWWFYLLIIVVCCVYGGLFVLAGFAYLC